MAPLADLWRREIVPSTAFRKAEYQSLEGAMDVPRGNIRAPCTGVIDAILEADRPVPGKQRHTAKRVFERLRDEHGFDGQYTIVKD